MDGQSSRVASRVPLLADGGVHIWTVHLPDVSLRQRYQLEATLARDEIERADRYVFQRDRDNFVASRGMLRRILSGYVDLAPAAICLAYRTHGKPYLTGDETLSGIRFNLSHSGDLALIAVACNREVGIDVEQHRSDVDIEGIAGSTFSPSEFAMLMALPHAQRIAGFFHCWSRKEAYIKARGEGLSYPLASFDVSLQPGSPAVMLRSDEGPRELERWALMDLDVGAGYAAAMVIERPVENLLFLCANLDLN